MSLMRFPVDDGKMSTTRLRPQSSMSVDIFGKVLAIRVETRRCGATMIGGIQGQRVDQKICKRVACACSVHKSALHSSMCLFNSRAG